MSYTAPTYTQPAQVITPTTISQELCVFLKHVFSYKRKHNSQTERQWLDAVLLPHLDAYEYWVDDVGNIHIDNRKTTTTSSRTLFTAHVDTVHNTEGRQLVESVSVNGVNTLRLTPPPYGTPAEYTSNCLGADDTAGVLMLLHLLKSNVPAYYIFTRGEECGGIGAGHLAEHHKDLLAEFDRAVAFDRRGTSSVITHQMVGRTCSDKFAEALSDALGTDTLMYAPDDTGSYTDTAEFIDVIPECTNISVGYEREHSANETLNLDHFIDLLNHVATINWDILPVERDPTAVDPIEDYNYGYTPYHKTEWWGDTTKTIEPRYYGASLSSVTEQDVIDLVVALKRARSDIKPLLRILNITPTHEEYYRLDIFDAQYFIEELEYVLDTQHSELATVYRDVIWDLHELFEQ
jgi:hypothetical protein